MMRERIWNKYANKCAYCGKKIELKDMQIDHIHPKYLGGEDKEENYNPSCRRCNKWKATYSIEEFRREITLQIERVYRKSAGLRLMADYKLITVNNQVPVFWFEECAEFERLLNKL